ncbi:MAG TPA: GGDEF domain-containing protein, partial [Afipia sp.]
MQFPSFQWLTAERLSDGVYAELIEELFAAAPSVVVVAISQSVIGTAIFLQTGDPIALGLTVAIVLISIERIIMMGRYRRATADKPLPRAEVAIWERRYADRSIASAAVVSAIGVRCFMLGDPAIQMLTVGMLSTYCAGTLMRAAHRPWLAIVNLLIISVPTTIAGMIHGGPIYICLALMTGILLVGAFDVIRHAYNTTVSQITLKRQFAGLARQDALTGLSNRLGLSENLEAVIADTQRNGYGLAVHCLDLDRFKAANDLYGHPTGDAILKEVARRLTCL